VHGRRRGRGTPRPPPPHAPARPPLAPRRPGPPLSPFRQAPGLPKTRSGKIMRRVLRKIASKEEDQLGDTSTLADPSVVQTLVDLRGK
jgi:hypothetical protein